MIVLVAVVCTASAAAAQSEEPCSYERCALRLEPGSLFSPYRLVRGAEGEVVARIGLWSDLPLMLSDVDSAVAYAESFQQKRRWSVGLGLVGAGLLVTTYLGDRDEVTGSDWAFLIGGNVVMWTGALIAQSAWRDLSRSIWWHNSRFADSARRNSDD